MSGITIQGDSREAVLLKIVSSLAYTEGKSFNSDDLVGKDETLTREWLREAFQFAHECLDGSAIADHAGLAQAMGGGSSGQDDA